MSTKQVWLITGSSRGFGRSLAQAVLAAGHQLIATARSTDPLAELAEHYGEQVRAVSLDVTDPAAAQRAADTAVTEFGHLDVVVNNAGYANVAPIETIDPDDFRAQIETNFFGLVNVTRAALPLLRRQRSGHFIQFATIGARAGAPGLAAYQSAKWAVEGFSEVLATDVSSFGVKVTIIEPGAFRTDWGGSSMEVADFGADYEATVGALARHLRQTTGSEPGDPDRAAQAILTIAQTAEPPLRLLLGGSAYRTAQLVTQQRAETDDRWRELSESADFPDAAQDDTGASLALQRNG
jgi:NAD(P)-dependent dehydrogenase (short-subunit alcohol dehydrogenase family)